ncbi:MAG: glutamine amidotransferase [Hyphomicrobiaceae bacterium]
MLDAEKYADGPGAETGGEQKRQPPTSLPVLLVMHQLHSTAGHVGRLLQQRGVPLDVRRPRFGERLPPTLEGHAGAVIFGGPMSANDDEDYLRQEMKLVSTALREERPFLGLCLGGQMLAKELGAKVALDPEDHVEIGYFPVEPCDGIEIGGEWPGQFYQWHREGFDLPAGAKLLARSDGRFENQAFQYGRAAFGTQFHPEISYALVSRWSAWNEEKLLLPGAWPRRRQLEDHIVQAPRVLRWLDQFLGEWLALGKKR